MATEASFEMPVVTSEEALRQRTIDTLAVFVVHETANNQPPIDRELSTFIGALTGLREEDVELRLEAISGGKEQPLLYDEETCRLKVNPDSEYAHALDYTAEPAVPIGASMFSTQTLRGYVEAFSTAQARVDQVKEVIKARADVWTFDPSGN